MKIRSDSEFEAAMIGEDPAAAAKLLLLLGNSPASDVGQVPAPLRRSGARRVVTTDDNHAGGGDVGSGSNDSVGMNIEFAN